MSELNLFFYGTLMSSHRRGYLLDNLARPIGRGTIRGDLYDVRGMFPAYDTGTRVVQGEVWRAYGPWSLGAALRITDRIEGYDPRDPLSMYVRQTVPLLSFDPDGYDEPVPPPVAAQVYRWNGATPPGPLIEDGCWTSYIRRVRRAPLEAAR